MAAAVPGVWPGLLPEHGEDQPGGWTVAFTVAFLVCRGIAAQSASRDGQVIGFWPATQGLVAAPLGGRVVRPGRHGVLAVGRRDRRRPDVFDHGCQESEGDGAAGGERAAPAGAGQPAVGVAEPAAALRPAGRRNAAEATADLGGTGRAWPSGRAARPVRHRRARRGPRPGGRGEYRAGMDLAGRAGFVRRVLAADPALAAHHVVRVQPGAAQHRTSRGRRCPPTSG